MSMADGYVLPQPGIPKTLGIISIILAVLGIFYGFCTFTTTILSGAVMEMSSGVMKQVVADAEAKKKADLQALDVEAKAASTDAQKASIKTRRDQIEAQPKLDADIADLDEAKEMLKNPAVMIPTYVIMLTGLLLAITLLIAGIGLIRLTPWGRTLSLWWAGLQIAQLLFWLIIELCVALPAQQAFQDKQMAQVQKQMKNANDPAAAQAATQMARVTQSLAAVFLFGGVFVGSIFPIVLLIMLNGDGARAACQGRSKPEILDSF